MKAFSSSVAVCAVVATCALMASNVLGVSEGLHARLGALPLALIGIAYALLQVGLKPGRTTLWRRLLLALAFLLWAVDQLLPAGRLATLTGDVVVSIYVIDLFWMMGEQKNPEP